MGSVRHLYTTGDNDPEIHPESYARHYLYCDACGSFRLEPWTTTADPARRDRIRRRLAVAALASSAVVLVGAWSALGLVPSPAALVAAVAGMALLVVLRRLLWAPKEHIAGPWGLFKAALPVLGVLVVVQLVVDDFPIPPRTVLLVGAALVAILLVWRALVGARDERLGWRCRECSATYAYGTPFFTDLAANPRRLTLEDVPRPLGVSPFERGEAVETVPGEPASRLPR